MKFTSSTCEGVDVVRVSGTATHFPVAHTRHAHPQRAPRKSRTRRPRSSHTRRRATSLTPAARISRSRWVRPLMAALGEGHGACEPVTGERWVTQGVWAWYGPGRGERAAAANWRGCGVAGARAHPRRSLWSASSVQKRHERCGAPAERAGERRMARRGGKERDHGRKGRPRGGPREAKARV